MSKAFHEEEDRGAAERAILYARHSSKEDQKKETIALTAKKVSNDESQKDSQIIKLLEQIRNRLTDMEKERGELWDTVQEQSKTLNRLEDHSTSTEKSFLSLENRLSRSELNEAPIVERLDDIERNLKTKSGSNEEQEKFQKDMMDRLEESDLHTTRLIERIDEAMAMQTRMTRRIDKMVQDKQRIFRKMALLEENMDAARNALASKALVLLGDRELLGNSGTPSPRIPIFTKTTYEDDFEEDLPPLRRDAKSDLDEMPHAQPQTPPLKSAQIHAHDTDRNPLRNQMIAASLFFMVAIGAGWFVSQQIQPNSIGTYQSGIVEKFEPIEPSNTTRLQQLAQNNYAPRQFAGYDDDQEVLAHRLNDIEPASTFDDTAPALSQNNAAQKPVTVQEIKAESVRTAKTSYDYDRDPDLPGAFIKLETEALNGSAEAQHDLAALYTAGQAGVTADYKRAAYWFEQAADQGVSNARYNLGVLYHQGMGVEQDLNKALDWYKKAAQLGHPEAQYNLGIAYIEGIGVDYDPGQAAEYFESAAASGITEAAFNLGLIYENGLTGQAQPDEALLWYKTAADQGNKDAQTALEQLSRSLNIDPSEVNTLVERLKTPPADTQGTLHRNTDAEPLNSKSKLNTANSLVAQVQDALKTYGLFPGPIDGVYGPLTGDAIRLYQARNDIPVTGDVSEELLVHMLSSNLRNRAYQGVGSAE